jgi:hypothetical protein
MSSELDRQIATILLAISAISLFLWVQVNRVSPLEGAMYASFGRRSKEPDGEKKAPQPKWKSRWIRSSLAVAAAALAYLFATRSP